MLDGEHASVRTDDALAGGLSDPSAALSTRLRQGRLPAPQTQRVARSMKDLSAGPS